MISALDGGDLSASGPGRFTPTERVPGIHWIGSWVGGRGDEEKNSQPLAQRYTTELTRHQSCDYCC